MVYAKIIPKLCHNVNRFVNIMMPRRYNGLGIDRDPRMQSMAMTHPR